MNLPVSFFTAGTLDITMLAGFVTLIGFFLLGTSAEGASFFGFFASGGEVVFALTVEGDSLFAVFNFSFLFAPSVVLVLTCLLLIVESACGFLATTSCSISLASVLSHSKTFVSSKRSPNDTNRLLIL